MFGFHSELPQALGGGAGRKARRYSHPVVSFGPQSSAQATMLESALPQPRVKRRSVQPSTRAPTFTVYASPKAKAEGYTNKRASWHSLPPRVTAQSQLRAVRNEVHASLRSAMNKSREQRVALPPLDFSKVEGADWIETRKGVTNVKADVKAEVKPANENATASRDPKRLRKLLEGMNSKLDTLAAKTAKIVAMLEELSAPGGRIAKLEDRQRVVEVASASAAETAPAMQLIQRQLARIETKYIPEIHRDLDRIEGVSQWSYATVLSDSLFLHTRPDTTSEVIDEMHRDDTIVVTQNIRETAEGLWIQARTPKNASAETWVLAESTDQSTDDDPDSSQGVAKANLGNYRMHI